MDRIYLDTNYLIDLFEGRNNFSKPNSFDFKHLFISPLSIHILCYINKCKIPDERINKLFEKYNIIEFNKKITYLATLGPTQDFEDNVQLHSALIKNCDIFLTSDKKLLKMKIFGNMLIRSSIE
jgi:hypothetical protein